MRFLFIMDPAETMLPTKDTSFAFMRAARARGHRSAHAVPNAVFNVGREVFARARSIEVSDAPPHSVLGAEEILPLADLDAVFVRKDPPFDAAYLHLTHQLDLVKGQTLVVNDPQALRDANEKLFAFHFAEFMPRSLVSSNPEQLLDFVSTVGGQAVIKPLDGAGGSGVIALKTGDRNNRAVIDLLTRTGTELALVQEFLPDVFAGDRRVLLLDGQVLGAIRRIPRDDDIRANIHVGGRVEAVTLSHSEHELASSVGARLREMGLWFVGLDLIAERLIEINVTSPTGIQELGRLSHSSPETNVIEWVERRSKQQKTS